MEFINYYKKTRNLSSQSAGDEVMTENQKTAMAEQFVILLCGSRDNFDWMSLKVI
jgi:ATP-dependent RNA helicase DeaD